MSVRCLTTCIALNFHRVTTLAHWNTSGHAEVSRLTDAFLQARYVQVQSLDNRVTSRYKKPCDEDAGDVEKDFAEKLFFCVLW